MASATVKRLRLERSSRSPRIILVASILIVGHVSSPGASAEVPGRVLDDEQRRIEMIERVAPSVVTIHPAGGRGGGSGVLIDSSGYGLSNYHVMAGILNGGGGTGGLNDGERYELEVLGIDPTGDVAMFRLLGRDDFPFAVLGDSDAVRVGDTAIAMGNPFSISEDESPTVTLGIVTGTHRYQWGVKGNLTYSDCIQTDAPINPGNSGGPLFNAAGEVIGINGRISVNTRGRFNVGFGYAITSNQIKRFIPALRAGLLARHGTMQATVEDSAGAGIVFDEIGPGGAAYNAGIRPSDVLISFDGIRITSPNHLVSVLGTYPEDWRVAVVTRRGARTLESFLRLDPINPNLKRPFSVNRSVSLRQIRRVIRAHREAVLTDPLRHAPRMLNWTVVREYLISSSGDKQQPARYEASLVRRGPVRMQRCYDDGGDGELIEFDDTRATRRMHGSDRALTLPADEAMIFCSRYLLHRFVLAPIESVSLEGVNHAGGNALRGVSELVEVIEWPVADNAVAALWFDTRSHDVVRIETYDRTSGIVATIDALDYRDVGGVRRPGVLEVRCQDYTYRDRLVDWEVIR